MNNKKIVNFLKLVNETRSAVLVGPLLKQTEKNLLKNKENILAIDGGLSKLMKMGIPASLSIGDNDSSANKLDILYPEEKESSDLKLGLDIFNEKLNKIELFGFLGGRHDHEIINLGEIYRFTKQRAYPFYAHFSYKIYFFPTGEYKFLIEGTFSIISFEELVISIEGDVKYPIKNKKLLAISSQGLSNEAHGEVSISSEKVFIIYSNNLKVL